jgi:hypothetical protein
VGANIERDDLQSPGHKNINANIFQSASMVNKSEGASSFSARENSLREFMDDQVLMSTERQNQTPAPQNSINPINNPSNTISNTLEQKEKLEVTEKYRRQELTRPLSKKFIFFWSLVALASLGLALTNLISIHSEGKLALPTSFENLLTILQKQILFSAIVVSYFDMLAFSTNSSLFLSNLDAYQQVNGQTSFVESNYPQFANFSAIYKNFTFVDLCEFTPCDPVFKTTLNYLYSSNIYNFNTFMLSNLDPTPVINE